MVSGLHQPEFDNSHIQHLLNVAEVLLLSVSAIVWQNVRLRPFADPTQLHLTSDFALSVVRKDQAG